MKLGLVGYGTIAAQTLQALAHAGEGVVDSVVILARAGCAARARRLELGDRPVDVVEDEAAFLAARPTIAAEVAGHAALAQHGPAILSAGIDLVVTSIGALADEDLHARLLRAARDGHARLILASGAIGGLDILAAARLAGLEEVVYTARKPPAAWRGTLAEGKVNLADLGHEATLYEGMARGAAVGYPQNANVAATVALTGLGFDRTQVRLVADPAVSSNVHELSFRSPAGAVSIRIEGRASPDNPKTSLATGLSVARAILANAPR